MSFDVSLRGPSGFDVDLQDAGGGVYTLTVDTAAIALTGGTVALRRALRLSVSSAAVTLTGSSVAPRLARRLSVSTSSITLSGSAVAAKVARRLAVASSAISLTGGSVTLTYTPAAQHITLAIDPGAITLTGNVIDFSLARASMARRGDDGGASSFTGQAKAAIYKRFIEEIEERFSEAPAPKTAKKRVKKIVQLQEAIAPIVEAIPEQRAPLKSLIDTLAEYDGTADEYTALMVLVQEQMERIEYEQARKQRNRRIAMAMLMAA